MVSLSARPRAVALLGPPMAEFSGSKNISMSSYSRKNSLRVLRPQVKVFVSFSALLTAVDPSASLPEVWGGCRRASIIPGGNLRPGS